MAKNDKKIKVLATRIEQLEKEIDEARKNRSKSYDIPKAVQRVADLKQDLKRLK